MAALHAWLTQDAMRLLALGKLWGGTLQAAMASNPLAFALGQVLVAASGLLPASVIAMMAGATFGFGWGLAFRLSRTMLRKWISAFVRRYPAAARFDAVVKQEGWRFVLLLRVSPVMPFAITSYGLGLSRIGQRDFLLGTLASLPALAGYVLLGALGRRGLILIGNVASPWHWLSLVGGISVVLYALWRLRKALERVASA